MHSPIDSESYVKPILGRTKIDIWECYASHVLQFIDSDKYGNLAYSDKPDLIDRTQSLGTPLLSGLWVWCLPNCGFKYVEGIFLGMRAPALFILRL